MKRTLATYWLCFLMYAFAGWLFEGTLYFVEDGNFVNSGMLNGPYCPIYGVGSMVLLLLFRREREHPVKLFLLGMAVCSGIELATSYALEALFDARWWDYSNRVFNFDGRICLEAALLFGVMSVLVVRVIQPLFNRALRPLGEKAIKRSAVGLLAIFVVDLCVTVYQLSIGALPSHVLRVE